ncbi:MAG: transposase, partial [Gemmatimonadales bacterium]
AYLGGIVRGLGGTALKVGGVSDHVHMLVRLKATLAIAETVEKVKGSSSKWMNERMPTRFQWQKGYSAFSVSPSAVESVTRYISNQAEHHKRVTFAEEYLGLLKCGIEYDERYVFECLCRRSAARR